MPRAHFQRLIAVLCLVAFGLAQGLVAPLFVRCEDASGHASIELACTKTSDGSCQTACSLRPLRVPADLPDPCDDEHGDHAPHPCKDTPLGDSTHSTKIPARSLVAGTFQFLAIPVLSVDPVAWQAHAAPPHAASIPPTARPPDTVARLRTVILIV